jgi:dTDP-glucose pyrophosphorylase
VADLALVMPMAGRGSRFAKAGRATPKPLIDLAGRPFFWWAIESVRRSVRLRELVCVVLDEHVREFAIDRRITDLFPEARIVALPEVTGGAAETAVRGLEALAGGGPVAINDSDHAFWCPELPDAAAALEAGLDAALLCFGSTDPAYSYVELDTAGAVRGTVEKQVVSPYAIAGCYLFSDRSVFEAAYRDYRRDCAYDELFVSGIYNRLIAGGGTVGRYLARRHLSFGTPAELARIAGDPAEIWCDHVG